MYLLDEWNYPINHSFSYQLEIVKAKIKSCQSKEEAEAMKFTEKNLINKVIPCQ